MHVKRRNEKPSLHKLNTEGESIHSPSTRYQSGCEQTKTQPYAWVCRSTKVRGANHV